MKSFKDILESFDGKYKNLKLWQTDAKSRGLKTQSGTSPDGDHTQYYTAKDKEGNDRGWFDKKKNKGELTNG